MPGSTLFLWFLIESGIIADFKGIRGLCDAAEIKHEVCGGLKLRLLDKKETVFIHTAYWIYGHECCIKLMTAEQSRATNSLGLVIVEW